MTSGRRVGLVVLAMAGGALVGATLTLAALPLLLSLLLFATAAVCLLAPRSMLWVLALVLFALVPLSALSVPGVLLSLTPPALILVVVAVRRLLDESRPPDLRVRPVTLLLLAYGGWLAVTVFASDYRSITVGWLLGYGLLVILPALLATTEPRVRDTLRFTWVGLGAVLGVYALVETFVLRSNPLLETVPGAGVDQTWSVYRATTTLGHPVSNGGFLAIAVPLALGLAIHRRSRLASLAAVLAAGGVVASGTRSAFAAMLVGAAVVALLPAGGATSRRRTLRRVVVMLGSLPVLLVGWAYLEVRSTSFEGERSAAFRATQVPIALDSVRDAPVLGTGPGAASFSHEALLERVGGAGAFENYWLELVVGAGVPGLVLGVLVVVAAVVSALRTGAPGVAGAVVTWSVSVTFVNAFEGGRPEFLVLGLVLAMALSTPRRDAAPAPDPVTESSSRAPLARVPAAGAEGALR